MIEKKKGAHLAGTVFETDRIAHFVAQLGTHLVRHTFSHGHGSYTSRLGATNHSIPLKVTKVRNYLAN